MADGDNNAFNIVPENYLSISYTKYLNALEEIAISEPKNFFRMRANMIDLVKSQTTIMIYNLIKGLLTTGRVDKPGQAGKAYIFGTEPKVLLVPDYPRQEINNIALSLVETINAFLDEHVCNILMPPRLQSIIGQSHTLSVEKETDTNIS